jgi:hypothetical protein
MRGWPDLHRIEAELRDESEIIANKCLKILQQGAISSYK